MLRNVHIGTLFNKDNENIEIIEIVPHTYVVASSLVQKMLNVN